MLAIDTAHFDTQILERLETITVASKVYDLDVPATPATIPGDSKNRVRPYVVYQAPAPGRPTMVELAETGDSLTLRPIVKAVAAYRHDVVNLAAQIRARLERWAPAPPEDLGNVLSISTLKFPIGFTAGSVAIDRGETPPRPWLLLQYEFTVST